MARRVLIVCDICKEEIGPDRNGLILQNEDVGAEVCAKQLMNPSTMLNALKVLGMAEEVTITQYRVNAEPRSERLDRVVSGNPSSIGVGLLRDARPRFSSSVKDSDSFKIPTNLGKNMLYVGGDAPMTDLPPGDVWIDAYVLKELLDTYEARYYG